MGEGENAEGEDEVLDDENASSHTRRLLKPCVYSQVLI
jgi:hypothetical protein